jgi:hypothetical protein
MTKISNFDRSVDYSAIRREVKAALALVEEKYGIACSRDRITFCGSEARGKLTMKPKMYQGTLKSLSDMGIPSNTRPNPGPITPLNTVTGSSQFQRAANVYNLDVTKMGPKGERLVDYKPSRYKYPFTYETVRGTRYKAGVTEIQRMFGK